MTLDLERELAVAAGERYAGLPRPLFTKLPASYRLVPLPLRILALRTLAKMRRMPSRFPDWPIERSIDAGVTTSGFGGHRAALVITHDVDTRHELELIQSIRELERHAGVISSWGFVPEISWPSAALVRALTEEECEIYWHDIRHDGRLPYGPTERICSAIERVDQASPWAKDTIRAFRSGQLLMSPTLLDALGGRFDIDMSIPDTELDGPYGSTAGCGTVYPFRIRGLIEIPLTLPQDVFLEQVQGLDASQVVGVWRDKLAYIKSVGGVAVLNVHPVWVGPTKPQLRRAYKDFLAEVASDPDLWIVTPSRLVDSLVE